MSAFPITRKRIAERDGGVKSGGDRARWWCRERPWYVRVWQSFSDPTLHTADKVAMRRYVYTRVSSYTIKCLVYIMKIKIHSSCEIEYFVETHLCKLCVILRSRVLRIVCPH